MKHPDVSMTGLEELQELFSRLSLRYDKMNNILSLGRHRAWKSCLADAVFEHGGEMALDVCCGTGDIALMLAHLPSTKRVIGLDYSEEMLDVARSRAEYLGEVQGAVPEFVLGNARDLPFKDECFDAVTASFALFPSPAPPDIAREIWRVLKPGGILACLDFARPVTHRARAAYRLRNTLTRLFAGAEREDYETLASKMIVFYTPEELDIMLSQVGFRGVVSSRLGSGLASLHLGVKL